MVDELLLILQPLTPAHGTDLFEGSEAEFILKGAEAHLVAGLPTADAIDGRHAPNIPVPGP